MRILAFDTATAATTAALVDAEAGLVLTARDDPPAGVRPDHARALLGLVDDVLRRSGGGWETVDRLAVGLGPGTFVGLRIGVASAQALALSQGRPLVGVSTLASLALGASTGVAPGQDVLAVIDARRGEAFVGSARESPRVVSPELLGDLGAGRLTVGDGAIKFRDVLQSGGAEVPDDDSPLHRVSAVWHCRLAETAIPQPLSAIQPHYLRVPDAELTR